MQLEKWDKKWLDEAVALWNEEIGKQFPMRRELFRQNSFQDPNISFEASSVAVDGNGKLVGFLTAKHWQEKESPVQLNPSIGWIQAVIVKKTSQRQGIATRMLEKAEKVLEKEQVEHLLMGRDPWHYFPGIPEEFEPAAEWAKRNGYVLTGSDIDLSQPFSPDNSPEMPEIEEGIYEVLRSNEKNQFMAFLKNNFPGRWEYEADQYFKKGGTGREYVVLKKAGQIVGFCRINDPDSPYIAQNVYWSPLFDGKTGGIGPLGIDSAERKKGYGRQIVEAGEAVLRQRGMENIVIDWTGLAEFYGKMGYRPWKVYQKYEKRNKN